MDECLPNPCKNGATCIDQVGDFQCQCLSGYTGETCQSGIPNRLVSLSVRHLYVLY